METTDKDGVAARKVKNLPAEEPTDPEVSCASVCDRCAETSDEHDLGRLGEAMNQLAIEDDSSAGGSNGSSKKIRYAGLERTTTGVIKVMRDAGNTATADLLEDMQQTNAEALRLLNNLRKLERRRASSSSSLKTAK